MTYTIYPVEEDHWIKVWKKIQAVAKRTGSKIIAVESQEFKACLNSSSFYSGYNTVIKLSVQQSLFPMNAKWARGKAKYVNEKYRKSIQAR